MSLVWPENRIALISLASQTFHLFAVPAEFVFRAVTGGATLSADVADHAAEAPGTAAPLAGSTLPR